jgi:hypothetical protein
MNAGFRRPQAGPSAWAWLRAHPWWGLSIGLHLGLVAGLLAHRGTPLPLPGQPVLSAAEQARVDASIERARRLQMQKHLRALEAIERELAGGDASRPRPAEPLPNDPQALLQRAREAATRIEQAEQRRRAEELSRLTGLPPEQALARVKAEPPVPKPTVPAATPEQAMRDLERQARDAQARRAQERARQQQGTRVAGASGAAGASGDRAQPSSESAQGGRRGGTPGAGTVDSEGGHGGGQAAPGDARAGGALESTMPVQEPRVYGAMRQSQALDAATLRPAHARRLGAGAPLATRVLPDGWYVAGPFEARGARSLHDPYPPEIAVDLDAAYAGQGGRLLEWRWVPVSPYPMVPPNRAENAVYYAWTEVHVDRAQDVVLEIGADDDSKLWLNDELVWVSDSLGDKPWYRQPFYGLDREIAQLNFVEGKKLVRLRTGRNTLLFKLYNGIDLMFFSVVITPPG